MGLKTITTALNHTFKDPLHQAPNQAPQSKNKHSTANLTEVEMNNHKNTQIYLPTRNTQFYLFTAYEKYYLLQEGKNIFNTRVLKQFSLRISFKEFSSHLPKVHTSQ